MLFSYLIVGKLKMPEQKIRRVLGIDPGLASTGYGIIDCLGNRYKLVTYGVISTAAKDEHKMRLLKIFNELNEIINIYKPSEAGMETLFFSRNVTSALSVAEARGVVTLCLACGNIDLSEYTPNQIKQAVSGTAAANKKLVEKYVKLLLGMKKEPKPDHAADALAAAITRIHTCLPNVNI